MPLRLGLLSTARINDEILQGAGPSPDVEVVAVGSRDSARAQAYAQAKGIARAHGSYEALLADPEVDAIYNSLPNSLHVPWTLRALEAGKHVLVEKPFDRRPEQVAHAFDAAEAAGLILMEAFMYRHHPQTKKLRDLVTGGSIGELREIRSTFTYQLDDPTDVRLFRALDGGSLMDLGCYCISGSRVLAGEPELVEGTQVIGGDGVDVHFTGTLTFPGGVVSRFECGFDSPYSSTLEAIGSDGSALVNEPWSCSEHAIELRRGCHTARVEVEDVDRYRLQLENFAAAIEGREEPLLGRADALGQVRTIEALYRSAEAGTPVAPAST
jgi:xylose dehydrogenase (NAD/NADP)